MNFGYHTQACECFSNKSLILPQKEAGTLFCLLTIEESDERMCQSTTEKNMCAPGLQNKIFKTPDVQQKLPREREGGHISSETF